MSYDPNSPQAQPSPAATQAQIQTNFAQFATIFARNHSAMNSSSQGDHEAVILQNQLADPDVLQDLVALYSKSATSLSGTQPQLFARIRQILPLVTNRPMQLTYNTVNTVGPNQFQSFLFDGYLLFFGSTNNIAVTITLTPSPTTTPFAIAIASNLNGGVPNNVSIVVLTQPNILKINSTSAVPGDVFYWIAIGKA